MSLKKLYRAARLKYLEHTFRSLSLMKPNRAACETIINELDASFFQTYSPDVGASTYLRSQYVTIDAYTLALKELASQVKEQRPIPYDWTTMSPKPVLVDRFLVSGDGYYQDPVRAITAFKEAGINLCQLMKESDTAQVGVYEHNLRVLTKLFINLREVTHGLVKVSLTNR